MLTFTKILKKIHVFTYLSCINIDGLNKMLIWSYKRKIWNIYQEKRNISFYFYKMYIIIDIITLNFVSDNT